MVEPCDQRQSNCRGFQTAPAVMRLTVRVPSEADHQLQPPHIAPEIRGAARGACAAVGMIGMAAGVLATFQTDNEIGTVPSSSPARSRV